MTLDLTFAQRLLATSAALALSATPAFAQVDEDELAATDAVQPGEEVELVGSDDEIVVTGIRASIAESLSLKRNASSIVEAISAEDIGKLPDLSIADSLARLPGVTAQRVRGRAQGISIRGLGPDFSIALLNGREIVSAGNNRGIEFDQFPSELIGTGVVYKSPTARLAATGIAGTVDLITVKPLDFAEDQVNLTARYVLNDNGQLNPDFADDGYRLFGSYIAVNDSQTAGITLSLTHQSNPTQFFSRELKTEFPFQVAEDGGVTYANDNPRTGVVSRDFERTSVAGSLQFEPNDRFRASADVLYNDYSDKGIFRGVETPLAGWSGNSVTNIQGTSGGFATSATYPLTPVILRTDTESNEVQTSAFGVNLAYDLTENFTIMADVSTSSLDRNDIDYESYAGTGRGIVGSGDPNLLSEITFTTPDNGEYTASDGRNIDYTDPNTVLLTDPGGWGQVGFVREPIVEDDLDSLRLEASYNVSAFDLVDQIAVGGIFTDREKSFTDNPRFLRAGQGFVNSSQTIPSGIIVGQTDAGSTGLPIIAYDPESLLTDGTYIQEPATPNTFQIEESTDTYYAIMDFSGDLGSIPFRGNVGVQYVDVQQGSTGLVPTAQGQAFTTLGTSYGDWLPSANISFEVMDRGFIKAAYANTLTRPLFNDLRASFGFGPDTTRVCPDTDGDGIPDTVAVPISAPNNLCFSGGGGNPFLRPYESDAFDLSFEKYVGASSAFILAGFYKDLTNYIQDERVFFDGSEFIRGFGAGDFLDANPSVSLTSFGGPVNTRNGEIYGVEGTIRVALDDFIDSPFLEGFGFNGSYGYTDATVERTDPQTGDLLTTEIPGYSEEVASGEIYYEQNGIQARVNANYRSGYRATVFLFDGTAFGARAVGRTVLDAKLGYEFQDGGLEGLYLGVEGYNLTDEPFRTKVPFNADGDTFISRREDYGRQFNLIVSKKF